MNSKQKAHDLLAYLANYWVEQELHFVESPEQIRESLNNFNREASLFRGFALRQVQAHFEYWIYDPLTETFGPNKFVGFQNMTFTKYQWAHELSKMELARGRFNGTRARRAICRVLGVDYEADRGLEEALERWAELLFGVSSVFVGRDRNIWRFVQLD